jgi:hypothetical protein
MFLTFYYYRRSYLFYCYRTRNVSKRAFKSNLDMTYNFFYVCVYVHVYALSYQMSDNFYILVDVPTMDLWKIKDDNYEDIPDNWTV